MNSCNCVRADGDCSDCCAYNGFTDGCYQDDDKVVSDPGTFFYSETSSSK